MSHVATPGLTFRETARLFSKVAAIHHNSTGTNFLPARANELAGISETCKLKGVQTESTAPSVTRSYRQTEGRAVAQTGAGWGQ